MATKKILREQVERERKYLSKLTEGTDEYNASQERLNKLLRELGNVEKQWTDTAIEVGKVVLCGIVVPVGMTLLTFKFEETGSLTTALRAWVTNNVPKKYM